MEIRSIAIAFAAYRELDNGELIHLGTYPSRKQAEDQIAAFNDAFPGNYHVREMRNGDVRMAL